MLITLPDGISSIDWTPPDPMVFVARNKWTGKRTNGDLGGVRAGWRASVSIVPGYIAAKQAWGRFFAQMRGAVNRFHLPATEGVQAGPATATWAMSGTGQVINYALYSEQFDNAAWAALSGGTVTANTDVAPDGTTTVDTINCAVVNRGMRQITALAASVGATYTFSVWLIGNVGETATISIRNSTGTVSSQTLAITLTATAVRYSVTVTLAAGATGFIDVWVYRDAGQTAATFKAWGAQVEDSGTASTYVATTSAATTSLAAFKVTGLTVSATNMTAGQLVTIGDRLFTLTADVVADIGGKAAVSVAPDLPVATTAASVAYVQQPYALMQLSGGPYGFSVSPGRIYLPEAFECEEVIA